MSEEAFGHPGIPPRWTSSSKEGVGTAYNTASRVWFTLSHGILNEVYAPRMDEAATRDLGFLVTSADGFFRTGDLAIHPESARRTYERIGSTDKQLLTLHDSGHCITVDRQWQTVAASTWDFNSGLDFTGTLLSGPAGHLTDDSLPEGQPRAEAKAGAWSGRHERHEWRGRSFSASGGHGQDRG